MDLYPEQTRLAKPRKQEEKERRDRMEERESKRGDQ